MVQAVDDSVPDPVRETDKPFLMPVEDVFTITGRGTVVTGRVERGEINVNAEVEIVGIREGSQKTTVTGIEMFHKLLDWPGRRQRRSAAARPRVRTWSAVRSSWRRAPRLRHTEFGPGLHPEQGRGRPSHAVLQQLPSAVLLPHHGRDRCRDPPEGTEMVMPGDNTEMLVKLIQPVAMDEGLRFAIREGGRTVGAGRVTKIIK